MISPQQLYQWLATPVPEQFDTNFSISGFSIDSRLCQHGDVFIAICGPHYDGHDFIDDAISRGAVMIIASKQTDTTVPRLKVDDTLTALAHIARHYRQTLTSTYIIAITGSVGKTSTKAMLTSVLDQHGGCYGTYANQNNTIGVPLNILQIRPQHRYAVIECGTNQPGEIKTLTQWVQPDMVLLLNAHDAHIGNFNGLQGIVDEKGDIIAHAPKHASVIFPQDKWGSEQWAACAKNRPCFTFSRNQHPACPIELVDHHLNEQHHVCMRIRHGQDAVSVTLPFAGEHMIDNALAVCTVAHVLRIPLDTLPLGLTSCQHPDGRVKKHQITKSLCCIDDAYNASPVSVQSAIKLLACHEGKRVLIFADMLELGDDAPIAHRHVAIQAHEQDIDMLITLGTLSIHTHQQAIAVGMPAIHLDDEQTLLDALIALSRSNTPTTILCKASNAMGLHRCVARLIAYATTEAKHDAHTKKTSAIS